MYNIDSWPSLLSQTINGKKYNKNVEELQTILTKLNFSTKGVDGFFGSNTRSAVINFQKSRSITTDGIVGPQTKAELKKALNVASNASPPKKDTGSTSINTSNKLSNDYVRSFNIKEKKIEGNAGYLIFFDNIRVDQFVTAFSTRIAKDGSIGTANIDMIYLPDFYKIETRSEDGKLLSSMDGIEHMTNVRIFIKNMFNGKYVMVFDGNIKSKRRSRTAHGYTMSFSATDYMTWLNKTLVPLAIGFQDTLTGGNRLRWLAQGVNIGKIAGVSSEADNAFRGKTIKEFIGSMLERTINGNAIYSEGNTAGYWDNASDRVRIMGDISDELIQQKIVDFVVSASDTSVNSMYVAINDIALNLMLEFYQDRDGLIRIKPPFWNQKVLKDHVIDPLLIVSLAENTDWGNEVTRVVVTGGAEEYQEDLTDYQKSMLVPSGALVGSKTPGQEKWSDYYNIDNDTLLRPSEEERKYGLSVYSTQQPLIKFSNSAAFDRNSATNILKKYAKFLYGFLNSGVETAPVTTVAMPWIRPGFNVWLDPVSSDKIYYVNSVSHSGSPQGGVYTTLDLSMGRDRINFNSTSSQNVDDNMFVNVLHQTSEDFGEVIKNAEEFESIRKKCLEFYKSDDPSIIKTNSSPYFHYFYGSNNYDKKNSGAGVVNSVANEVAKTVPEENVKGVMDIYNAPPPSRFSQIFGLGDKDDEIMYAQYRLIELGALKQKDVKEIGVYCEATQDSIIKFLNIINRTDITYKGMLTHVIAKSIYDKFVTELNPSAAEEKEEEFFLPLGLF